MAPALCIADARIWEPEWLRVQTFRLNPGARRFRFVQFTDVHFKGDRAWLGEVIRRINSLSPDFACFTGDLIEEAQHFDAAVEELAKLRMPLFAVPGNHDHWSRADFAPMAALCQQTGGAWLEDRHTTAAGGRVAIIGVDRWPARCVAAPGLFNLLLCHYPAQANDLGGRRYDLMLAGHSHGGQVRLPLIGPLITPSRTAGYNLGWYDTPAGRLYVNPGIGTLGSFNVRFNCRPELTVFEA